MAICSQGLSETTVPGWALLAQSARAARPLSIAAAACAALCFSPAALGGIVPTGACCSGTGCSVMTHAACAAASGTYRGDGTLCGVVLAGNPRTYGPSLPNLTIGPNAGQNAVDSFAIVVGAPTSIGMVQLSVNITHTWVSDLTIDLLYGPTNTRVRVWNRVCGNNDNIYVTFADGAATLVCGTPTSGVYAPANPLSAFIGLNANQVWSLEVNDNADQDQGTLVAWSLTFDDSLGDLCAQPFCAADFNGAGGRTVQDIFDFLAAWFTGSLAADFNGSGFVTVQDIFDFLAAWFGGC